MSVSRTLRGDSVSRRRQFDADRTPGPGSPVSRHDIRHVEIYDSARKHGIADEDIEHAINHAVVVGEQDDAKVLYLGPDRAGNLLD